MRFPLSLFILAAFAVPGCSSPQKKAKAAERQQKEEDTRATEQRRMLAVENGTVNSARGAEIFQPDSHRSFDPNSYTAAAAHSYGTKGATSKTFESDQQMRLDAYQTRNLYDARGNTAAQRKFATADAKTHPFLLTDKNPGAKTAATKEAWDAKKGAPSHEATDARRPYLGAESKKMKTAVDAKSLANWKSGETVIESDGEIEKVSTLKQLSIDDIRDLLNKSK